MAREVEVRAGLVLYGGSSLAVYMGGVALEFLQAVKASRERHLPYAPLLQAMGADFVVDLISGTSAGGLNGAFLARALTTGGSLEQISRLWREMGDFAALADWSREEGPPESLLNGRYFHRRLEEALGRISGPGPLVEMLDLFLTATDVAGRYWQRTDFLEHKVLGRQHLKYFQLKYRRGRSEMEPGLEWLGYDQERNDFADRQAEQDALKVKRLAKLARTTAAFPAAFEPVEWRPEEVYAGEPEEGANPRRKVWMADGGMLDNAPFAPALKAVHNRAATRVVDRVLFYVEPDPVDAIVPTGARRDEKPHALRMAWAALDLRLYQGISEHLRGIGEQSQMVDHLHRLVEQLSARLEGAAAQPELNGSPVHEAYLLLRRTQLARAVHQLVGRAYRGFRQAHPEAADPAGWLPDPLEEGYWESFRRTGDTLYRTRLLHFLLEQVRRLQAGAPLGSERLRQVLALKAQLWRLVRELRRLEWEWWSGRREVAVGGLTFRLPDLFRPDLRGDRKELLRQAVAQLLQEHEAELRRESPRARLAALGLEQQWHHFEAFDLILYPLAIGSDLGERDPIEWVRISPYDADTLLFPERMREGWEEGAREERTVSDAERAAYGKAKMAGDTLFHFGGFLSQRWRANDFLWGRLDAADQIIATLVRAAERSGRYSAEQLRAIRRAAREARLEACRQILLQELDDQGLERLAARVQPPAEEPTPEAEALEQLQSRLRQVAAGALAAEQLPATMAPAADQPTPRRQSLEWLIRRHARWEELQAYLLQDHRTGLESPASLPPAVLANTAVDILQNARQVLGQIARASPLKLPAPIRWAARGLGLLFTLTRWAVKRFLPRP
ncbi:MAG: patatin-like protein [Bacillota bacterium]